MYKVFSFNRDELKTGITSHFKNIFKNPILFEMQIRFFLFHIYVENFISNGSGTQPNSTNQVGDEIESE